MHTKIFTLITFAATIVSAAEYCNVQMKRGPYKIKNLKINAPKETLQKDVVVTIAETDYEENIIIGYKGYYQAYSYNGGSLDPNTRIEETIKTLDVSKEDLLVWLYRQQCEVGVELIDRWGSDSDECLRNTDGRGVWVKTKELVKRQNNNHFAYHTCNRSWRCGFSTAKMYTKLVCDDDTDNCDIYTLDADGKVINITIDAALHKDGVSMVLKDKPKYKFRDETVACLLIKDNVKDPNDVTREHCLIDNDIFDLTDNKWYCNFNKCIKRKSEHKAKERPNKWQSNVKAKYDEGKSATKGDLMHLQEELMYENDVLKMNIEIMHAHINKLNNMLHDLIISVAKVDEKLIGNLMNNSVSSVFLSDNTFLLMPCTTPPPQTSNCYNNSIYKEGRWVANTDSSQCIDFNNYIDLAIDDDVEFWVPTIGNVSYHESWKDASGWSFIAQQKSNLISTMEDTKFGGKDTALGDLLSLSPGELKAKLTSFMFGGIINYIILFAVIIFIICMMRMRSRTY
ncbi:GP64 [Lonomia obliqua multiple nucleopolyhedrovirus]|uniref:GP64 n=1 Tax=Lonomia obliqua multiple nucleopolyhedrovirus TaxID=134394 RepID=A0A126FC37_9ABAC|nr:GP64 [Lonomia obliqua multiple nucleopolyhedrovirus]AKN80958.1 GP64 [Lonomia obliqua multiple nucleopolyhedrovirus]